MASDKINIVSETTLKEKLKNRTARIGVIGLGYTGLPLAIEFAAGGFATVGFEVDGYRVKSINSGESYLKDIESETIKKLLSAGTLSATDDFSLISDIDVIQICVPTPLTEAREPDMTFVIEASRAIAPGLKKEQLVVLQSTTYPGTTEEIVLPILEGTGLKAGEDFYLGYSPERVDPGNKKYGIKNTPKVVGGLTIKCLEQIKALYESIVDDVVPVSSLKAAELTKLFENIYRNINIALVNELTMICGRMSINVWEVIDAAATKPFGFMKFSPGPGVGGHCISVDPFYLAWKARQYNFSTEFIELAGKINQNMPYFVVSRVVDALNDRKKSLNGSRVLILGVAYKKNIEDARESPAFQIIEILREKGAVVSFHDPFVKELYKYDLISETLSAELIRASDCAVIVTDHSDIDYELLVGEADLIIDTRNILSGYNSGNVIRI